jgi:hypothetical protein
VAPIAEQGMHRVFSELNLDSDEEIEVPHMAVNTCQLITGIDNDNWRLQGVDEKLIAMQRDAERFLGVRGVNMFATCTPYQVGNVPVFGEHCAWMESSAVIYCNSVLGARTNVEGKESTGAAALTGRIPYWGFHVTENRYGSHLVELAIAVDDMQDWGLLGYWVGEMVQEAIPVVSGITAHPDLVKLKHFGAAAASSGGVEMYHIPGVTPEAPSVAAAFGPKAPLATLRYGTAERRDAYRKLQSATERKVDFIMLGCPHNAIEQVALIAQLLAGRRIHPDVALWVHTPRALKQVAERNGYLETIEAAGGVVMSDTCPAISRRLPPGVRVIATDSAKQAHYLPVICNVQGWFGSVRDCIDAALSGEWRGEIA